MTTSHPMADAAGRVAGQDLLAHCVPWPEGSAQSYRSSGYWRGQTFGAWLTRLAEEHGQRTALIDDRRRISYAELDAAATALANGLRKSGIQPRDRVLVQIPNRVEWFEVFFALLRCGAIPVLCNPAHRRLELIHFAKVTEAVAYIGVAQHNGFDYRDLAAALKPECETLRQVFILDEPGKFQVVPEAQGSSEPLSGSTASDVALFQLSGASTGISKLIPRTHDDYLYSIRQSAEICGLDRETRYLAVLPVSHNFPLTSPGALGTLCVGGTVVLSNGATPEVAFRWLVEERITVTSLVPSLATVWLQAQQRLKPDLSALELLQVGGARLDPNLARQLYRSFGGALQQVFGMAEGLVCYTRPGDAEERVITTQGRPMSPADEILIVDENDEPVPADTVGDLLTRGPYTIRGYYKAPEHNTRAFTRDGFYRTGDRVRRTPEGDLVVEGRSKDQIQRGGEKIGPQEVEEQLRLLPGIADAAVIAVPDAYLGERSHAFLVLHASADPALSKAITIRRSLRDRLADFKIPDSVTVLPSLPTTPIGKIDKQRLRMLALEASGTAERNP